MTVPVLALVELPTAAPSPPQGPPVALGPSLGTSVAFLWAAAAHGPQGGFRAGGRDLPGRGASAPAHHPFTTAGPSGTVLATVDGLTTEGEDERPFFCAGHSTGGCVGQQLLLDAPRRRFAPGSVEKDRPRPRPCGATSARRTGPRAPGRPGAVVLEGTAHLLPPEVPQDVARRLGDHFTVRPDRTAEGARA